MPKLNQQMKVMQSENYKTFIKEIEDDIKKWKDILVLLGWK